MRNEEEALFGSSDDFFRLRQSPRVQMIAWLLSQSWRSTQDGSVVTCVRVGVEFHISHCWQGSVSHPLFILKALYSPSLCVLTGGGKRMNSVFPMVHWSLGPGSFNLKSQKWWFPQEQMAPIASLGYTPFWRVSVSAPPFHPEIWGAVKPAKSTTSQHK